MKKAKKMTAAILAAALLLSSIPGNVFANTQDEEKETTKVQAEFYVSPDGDDQNPGTYEKPFATLQAARDAVREINDNMTGDIIVNVGAGEYYTTETVCLDERDSGTNGYQVVYRSAEGIGSAKINGGVLVDGWKVTTNADIEMGLDESLVGKVYKVQLDPKQYDFNALYVNDEKATMARTRNYKHDAEFPSQRGEYMYSAGGGMRDLIWKEGDLDQKSIDGMVAAQERGEEEIAQLFVWDGGDWDWFTNTLPINGIDVSQRKVWAKEYPDQPERNRTRYPIGTGARYYLQGNLAFLDVPGEYHYNKTTGELYYYPKEGQEKMDAQRVVVPMVQEVLRLEGSDKPTIPEWGNEPNPHKQVHDIVIDGLIIKNTEYTNYFTPGWNYKDAGGGIGYHSPESYGSTQPSYHEAADRPEYMVGAITVINSNHITIQNSKIHNTGLWGIAFWRDNQYHTVKNCDIGYTGYGAITLDGGYPGVGKYCNHNLVENVRMHDVGQNIGHAGALTVLSTGQSNFRNLEIYNSPRRGLSVTAMNNRDETDAAYNPLTDMYTVQNHFEYIYAHNLEQDSGEDSGLFFYVLFMGRDLNRMFGTNAVDETGYKYYDVGPDHYNYVNQVLIDSVGSNPTMRDKNTVHGMEFVGCSGTHISNVKSVNPQSRTIWIPSPNDTFDGKLFAENTNCNFYDREYTQRLDESKMEYDKIGLTDEFPFDAEYEPVVPEKPEDIYFSDDFESDGLDLRKWTIEKGNPHIDHNYMSEGPWYGQSSLGLNGDVNKPSGVVVSRTFKNRLNKVVEVKYFDKYQDYAYSDGANSGSRDISPDSWVRVGEKDNFYALGANGDISREHYLYQVGEELIETEVRRCYGWHSFKFDYSSGTDAKLYIDDQLVATLPAESFNYVGMGDWNGKSGEGFYDELYIYGGKEAPPVEDLPLPTPPEQPEEVLLYEDFESENPTEFVARKGNAEIEILQSPDNQDNKVMKVSSPDDLIYYPEGTSWSNYIFECQIMIDNWNVGTQQPWDNMAPAWNINPESQNRYTVKYNRDSKNFALYKRDGGDKDMVFAQSPENYEGKWHDYKISYAGGLITVYINGEKIFEHTDTFNSSGTIGFDGINVEYYVDDIKVTRQKTPNPSADKEEGSYSQPIEVRLLPQSQNQDIFYTLDGTDPTNPEHGQFYISGQPIIIDKTTTLKFAAIADGALYSDVIEKVYTIESGETVDKSELEILYEQYKDMQNQGYTEESWDAFQKALAEAKAVLDNTQASQNEVDLAVEMLKQSFENLVVSTDKTLLQKTYDYALTLDTEGVVESAVKLFENAKKNAKSVLDNPNATQEEVNTAWDELLESIWGLGITQGDKTLLSLLVAKGETMMANADKYVDTYWQEFVDAFNKAKTVMESGDALQEDVDAAVEELGNAIMLQRYKANKENLEELVNKANGMDVSQYTAESVAVFRAALTNANLVLADESLSEDDQSVVDNAVKELDAAIKNLSTADGTPSNPDEPSDPDKGDEGTPTTGDYSDIAILFTAAFAAMMLAALVIIWRKKQIEK